MVKIFMGDTSIFMALLFILGDDGCGFTLWVVCILQIWRYKGIFSN
jgi:hypothetical protein